MEDKTLLKVIAAISDTLAGKIIIMILVIVILVSELLQEKQ